jgi:biopolymer transport protein ExbD
MSIKIRNKRSANAGMASMSDLVFLLLIFFILVSTLVSPNAVDLTLPKTSETGKANNQNIEVYINADLEYFINKKSNPVPVTEEMLQGSIQNALESASKGAVVLRADKDVPIQNVINVLDAVNTINRETGSEFKVSLAAEPK